MLNHGQWVLWLVAGCGLLLVWAALGSSLAAAPERGERVAPQLPASTVFPGAGKVYAPLVRNAPPPTATPPAAAVSCDVPGGPQVPNTPIHISSVNKVAETVTIKNVTAQSVDVTGWWICSIKGGQLHAVLSGVLAPGQSIVVASQAGELIWNNLTPDPAALYNRQGVQISYSYQ